MYHINLIAFLTTFTIQRPYRIIITNHTAESYSPKCRLNATFDGSAPFAFDINVEFLKTIRKPFIAVKIFCESDPGKYNMELVNRTIDLCQLIRNKRREPILQVVFRLLEGFQTHWFSNCPINKVRRRLMILSKLM